MQGNDQPDDDPREAVEEHLIALDEADLDYPRDVWTDLTIARDRIRAAREKLLAGGWAESRTASARDSALFKAETQVAGIAYILEEDVQSASVDEVADEG